MRLATLTYAEQGWSAADRETFYTTSQGSHLIPYVWFKALKRTDVDEPFAADKLQRYGFLPHDASPANPEGLPVGFVIDGPVASGQFGLTCAACHTGQLEYRQGGVIHALRIDGAPAKTDAQQFLADLLAASRATLAEPARFDAFAKAVLGPGYNAAKAAQVKDGLGKWVAQFGEFMDVSLPAASPWGPGRLDAFGMIFNRIAARDLGIPANYKVADAPVRYPFVWNASRQDRTQWNGGVQNGLYIQALGRNTGEVLGVFADFAPHRLLPPTPLAPAIIDFKNNSVNFGGLQTLEEKIAALRPPPWPREIFGLDEALGGEGQAIVQRQLRRLSRGAAFARSAGTLAHPDPRGWHGPEDAEELAAHRSARAALGRVDAPARHRRPDWRSGQGQRPSRHGGRRNPARGGFPTAGPAADEARSERRLPGAARRISSSTFRARISTRCSTRGCSAKAKIDALVELKAFIDAKLSNMFNPPPAVGEAAYEARVLDGVWAVAPYLHNGSVPNLWELMKLAKDRKPSFMVGSRVFDPKNVGYAVDESPFKAGSLHGRPGEREWRRQRRPRIRRRPHRRRTLGDHRIYEDLLARRPFARASRVRCLCGRAPSRPDRRPASARRICGTGG